jgi:hypothetical protein
LASSSSDRYAPSWPVAPVIKATLFIIGNDPRRWNAFESVLIRNYYDYNRLINISSVLVAPWAEAICGSTRAAAGSPQPIVVLGAVQPD